MGGYWAFLYALASPARVDRLIIIGEPAGSTARLGLTSALSVHPG